jgi:putative PIN family toxin of toxin-antitoxin system
MRVVIDTNIFISGFRTDGNPKLVLDLAFARQFVLVINESILGELKRILPRKLKWSTSMTEAAIEGIVQIAEIVSGDLRVKACIDPDDDRILEAAIAGRAECIVTGDGDLLRMKRYEAVEILTAREFLERFPSRP